MDDNEYSDHQTGREHGQKERKDLKDALCRLRSSDSLADNPTRPALEVYQFHGIEQRRISGLIMSEGRKLGMSRLYDQQFFNLLSSFVHLIRIEHDHELRVEEMMLKSELKKDIRGRRLLFLRTLYAVATKYAEMLRKEYRQSSGERMVFEALSFMNTFYFASFGLDWCKQGPGRIGIGQRREFKIDLIEAYQARRLTNPSALWDCVNRKYRKADDMKALQIVGYRKSWKSFELIFGDDCKDEMFSCYNGLLVDAWIREGFNKWWLVLVPDVDDIGDRSAILNWEKQHPREYKIQVLDPYYRAMSEQDRFGYRCCLAYSSLEDRRLTFKSDHRPRERYIYWRYLLGMYYLSVRYDRLEKERRKSFPTRPKSSRTPSKDIGDTTDSSSASEDGHCCLSSSKHIQSCPVSMFGPPFWVSTDGEGIRKVLYQVFHETHDRTFEVLAEYLQFLKEPVTGYEAVDMENYLAGVRKCSMWLTNGDAPGPLDSDGED